ncbi:DNA alkylation repair protein [Cohnella algarum]|uniref:DNA alkylation repair protein n=1 Tax=Cohnella algarum TaxID=2044859 RepID=UPI00196707F5|nr:DNA alkylation repair protein [Cohnella algarum]MBN2981050.1 DNA alkylation repair protein [Cohnella algarum]
MGELLKDIYDLHFFDGLIHGLKNEYPAFDGHRFMTGVLSGDWDSLALKQRMRRITEGLVQGLPASYEEALAVLAAVAPHFNGFAYMIFPDFVEARGLDDPDLSIPALERFTPYSSSEFAVRPFIIRYPDRMLKQLELWAQHENEHVRRLASEGCRPRLPWAMSLPPFKRDPVPVLRILEHLKEDSSLYVRRSVANNLNDISKDNPDIVLQLAKEWRGKHPHTDWILKHGCRTLLKKCDADALELFGFIGTDAVAVKDFALEPRTVRIGEEVTMSFCVQNESDKPQKLRVEYKVDFLKSRGTYSSKLFKISEKLYRPGETAVSVSHSFKPMTTRTHYPGEHFISVIVNGKALANQSMLLERGDPPS